MARFEAFWEEACEYRMYMWMGVMLMIFFLVLEVISFLLVEPWTGSFWIAVFNFGLTVTVGGVVGWMFWTCKERAERYY